MDIKFIRGVARFGYAYRAGMGASTLPDDVCKRFIRDGFAIEIKDHPRPQRAVVQTTIVEEVETTQVKRRRKKSDI